jgi:hypothetical protein
MHDVSDNRLVRIDWRPSTTSLRSFGAALIILLASSVLSRHLRSSELALLHDPLDLACGALVLLTAALTLRRPAWLRPAYVVMGVATYPARWLLAVFSLSVLYFGVITPIAIGLRCVRKHRAQSGATAGGSAWVVSRPRQDKAHYFRQF